MNLRHTKLQFSNKNLEFLPDFLQVFSRTNCSLREPPKRQNRMHNSYIKEPRFSGCEQCSVVWIHMHFSHMSITLLHLVLVRLMSIWHTVFQGFEWFRIPFTHRARYALYVQYNRALLAIFENQMTVICSDDELLKKRRCPFILLLFCSAIQKLWHQFSGPNFQDRLHVHVLIRATLSSHVRTN